MKKILPFTMSLVILVLMTSCHSSNLVGTTSSGSEMLYRYKWDLTELRGQEVALATGKQPHLLFSISKPGSLTGNTGCNNLTGSFELTGVNFIKFSPLAITKMACPGNNFEPLFIEALGQVNNWRIIGNQLLLNNGKTVVAKFKGLSMETSTLIGNWELNYISGKRIAFEGLYPDRKPEISFNLAVNELGGNTSCNGFSSKMIIDGNKISIAEPFAKTMIFCEGEGEVVFLDMLKKVNRYNVTNSNTLTFLIDDVAVMRFAKK